MWNSIAVVGAILLAAGTFVASADATTFGQIGEGWGSPGGGAGQFSNPAMFGVDPSDGSVYAGDVTSDGKYYRIQKFSGSGEFEASVEIPRIQEEKIVTLHGVAVDPILHRFYVIEGCHLAKPAGSCKSFGSTYGARRVLVFSTEPQGTELVPAEGVATLPLPSGEETLFTPQGIAVDPSNHNVVILAENTSGHTTIQRISSTGAPGARFVDTGNVLRPPGEEATSIAVGPTGTIYTLTGGPNAPGAEHTRAWELSSDLSTLTKVPGFAEAAEDEGWATGLLSPKSSPLLGGPQIAISPDGSTLYWKESLRQSTPTEAGEVLARGYSLTESATKALYGGGRERCAITTSSAGLGATGEDLVVFDYGPEVENPSFGDKVLTFGPGGNGCPTPTAKFSVNGKEEEDIPVEKGETVTFDASKSELFEGFRRELIWNFGDGTQKVVPCPLEEGECKEEAPLTITHKYMSSGDFTVRLEIKLSEAPFGSPPPVERTLSVQGLKPKFKLTVSPLGSGEGTVTSSPGGIACGSSCEAEYEEGTAVTLSPAPAEGSEFHGWGGACTGTGTCEVTMSQARSVSAEFVAKPKLTVSDTGSGEGTVTSSPAGINCGATCAAQYSTNTVVTLTATPAEHSEFKSWTGACTGTGTCEVTMSQARSVSAEFEHKPKFKLTVSDTGPGEGTVTSSPGGINCGGTCEAEYEKGTVVTLVPAAGEHSEFHGWSGACAGTGTCEVTMSEAKSVSAEFVPVATPRFKLEVSETGSGLVTSVPGGIVCGAICERGYEKDAVVTLIPIPGVASEFKGWGGACAGTSACEVKMSEAREVTASFGNVLTVPPIEPVGGGGPSPGSEPTGEELPHHRHPKPKAPSLARCKKLKGKKKAKCIRHAHRRGR